MFTIGDFAKLGRVSVRMLRHYDAVGVLTPAAVDPASGYRRYRADQLRRLNRVIALKDLGFTLHQVRAILDDQVSVEELRGMLRLRRAQLEAQLTADAARLAEVEARLRMIEREGHMSTEDVVLKPVPQVRVAELTGVAASYEAEHIGPVIQPLYRELFRRLDAAGVSPSGPGIAYYDPAPGESGEAVTVHAGVQVATYSRPEHDFAVRDLPAIPSAATVIHRGSMDEADRSVQILARWIDDNGYRMIGYAREVCLEFVPDDPDKWVHELQLAVTRD
ncbi:MAG TPA: MerR family transcriptional regulator [Pilimelia sp.]|nr:MerR family transcriptional regulator [Pilimelia sp.]